MIFQENKKVFIAKKWLEIRNKKKYISTLFYSEYSMAKSLCNQYISLSKSIKQVSYSGIHAIWELKYKTIQRCFKLYKMILVHLIILVLPPNVCHFVHLVYRVNVENQITQSVKVEKQKYKKYFHRFLEFFHFLLLNYFIQFFFCICS